MSVFYDQLFCSVVLGALSCFGIILLKRRGLVALIVAVCVVCLCLLMPWVVVCSLFIPV